jgi:NitT/TauT family transport system ATP-binding protein
LSAISLRNIVARYPGRYQPPVLNIDCLDIRHGEIIGVNGPNYAGKTTLLRILAVAARGIALSKNAEVLYDGEPFGRRFRQPFISYVPQDYSKTLLPWYTIARNLRLPLLVNSAPAHQVAESMGNLCKGFEARDEAALFQRFGFGSDHDPDSSKSPLELSGGQQQMLVLLRSLIRQPDLLVLDEPFSAVDTYRGAEFRRLFRKYIVAGQITTVFVSHDLTETVELAHRIIFLKHGEMGSEIAGIEEVPHDAETSSPFMEKLRTQYLSSPQVLSEAAC